MPWHVAKNSECADSEPWAVIKDDDDSVVACHETEEEAKDQMAALYASEERGLIMSVLNRFLEVLRLSPLWPMPEKPEPQERSVSMPLLYEQVQVQLYDMDVWAWLMDLYLDAGETYAVLTAAGKLYRADVAIEDGQAVIAAFDDWLEVETEFVPVGQSRTVVREQADGRFRWFSVSCTSVLNRIGEIDSRDLFDSFVRQVEEGGEYPIRDFYHGGETFRTGQADFMARDENLLITSGLYDETELGKREVMARQARPDYWGDSIAYTPSGVPDMVDVAEGVSVPVYREGTIEFISTLPEAGAAALFTVGTVTEEVARMLKGKAFEAFVELFDGDEDNARTWLEANVDETNRSIESEGLVTRGAGVEEPTPEPAAEPAAEKQGGEPEPQEREIILDEDAIEALVDKVAAASVFGALLAQVDEMTAAMTALSERMTEIADDVATLGTEANARLADLERDDEERQREWQTDLPARNQVRVSYRPREARDPASQNEQPSLADAAAATLADVPAQY